MKKSILITGCSSGLGLGLTNLYLSLGFNVYGISRNQPNINNQNFKHLSFDLSDVRNIKNNCAEFIKNIKEIDVAYLNAGMLGEIKTLSELSIDELNEV